MDQPITFQAGDIVLEARLNRQATERAAVIAHPHPLYGGDMDNGVVLALAEAYTRQGWTTLRFNFRGTGRSTGQFDDGAGEQDDLQSAIDFLRHAGYARIDLAGYSFGAWVIACWARAHAHHAHRVLLVAPPVAFIDFGSRAPIPGLSRVFAGDMDDLAPPAHIRKALPFWDPAARMELIQGADHSFWGHFQDLQQALTGTIGG